MKKFFRGKPRNPYIFIFIRQHKNNDIFLLLFYLPSCGAEKKSRLVRWTFWQYFGEKCIWNGFFYLAVASYWRLMEKLHRLHRENIEAQKQEGERAINEKRCMASYSRHVLKNKKSIFFRRQSLAFAACIITFGVHAFCKGKRGQRLFFWKCIGTSLKGSNGK